jgi:hypothetical protein
MALTEAEKNYIVRDAQTQNIKIEVHETEWVKKTYGGGAKLEFIRGYPEFVRREYSYTIDIPLFYMPRSRSFKSICSVRQWEEAKQELLQKRTNSR